jgi:hypothetical protein
MENRVNLEHGRGVAFPGYPRKSSGDEPMPKGIFPRPIRRVIFVIGPSIAYVPLSAGLFSLIEVESAPLVDGKNWCAVYRKRARKFYVSRKVGHRGETEYLHRIILGAPSHLGGDHVNGNTLDNRFHGNLRLATGFQNMANAAINRDNRSGFKGVDLYRNRFRARIRSSGVSYDLGSFATAEAAHAAYCAKARQLNGAFARFE